MVRRYRERRDEEWEGEGGLKRDSGHESSWNVNGIKLKLWLPPGINKSRGSRGFI